MYWPTSGGAKRIQAPSPEARNASDSLIADWLSRAVR